MLPVDKYVGISGVVEVMCELVATKKNNLFERVGGHISYDVICTKDIYVQLS